MQNVDKMKLEYTNFQGFENVFLEDSFVLKIKTSKSFAEFFVEIILRKHHPLYSKPKPKEQYCYKNGIISFPQIENIIWVKVNMNPSTDANNEVDFGNIDSFFYENDFYNILGDWGELKIQSQGPIIKFVDE